MIHIVGLNGSLRPGSYSKHALQIALKQAEQFGASVEFLDLQVLKLPFCNGAKAYSEYPDVEYLQSAVTKADGLILATPEYHGSVSGVLKNALDLLSFDQLAGKVTAAISILGGQANSNALNDLRLIKRPSPHHSMGACLDDSRAGGHWSGMEGIRCGGESH
jgi:FMN reductase